MTRDEMNQAVLSVDDEEFQSEIRYFRDDIDREDEDGIGYDTVSALFDLEDQLERGDWGCGRRRLLTLCRKTLITIGFYRVMPQDEIDSTFSSAGGPVWCFKLNKVAYTTNHNVESWQFPAQQPA